MTSIRGQAPARKIGLLVPRERAQGLVPRPLGQRRRIPAADAALISSRDELVAVPAEGEAPDQPGVTREREQFVERGGVPDPDDPIPARGGQARPSGLKRTLWTIAARADVLRTTRAESTSQRVRSPRELSNESPVELARRPAPGMERRLKTGARAGGSPAARTSRHPRSGSSRPGSPRRSAGHRERRRRPQRPSCGRSGCAGPPWRRPTRGPCHHHGLRRAGDCRG